MNNVRLLRRKLLLAGASAALAGPIRLVNAQGTLRAEYESFISEMADKHSLDKGAMRRLFAQVKPLPSILRFMTAPSTSRPWYEFRKSHVGQARINGGVKFWRQHTTTLARATQTFGVPAEIIVATLGIETHYGGYTGNYRILDALATLAFDFPQRAEFFRGELEAFLLLGRETNINLVTARGSYAGAMGVPQFLPSSYRKFAVDFDGDGQRNLWKSIPDVIGSVANYYKLHQWQPGAAIVVPANVSKTPDESLTDDITPKTPIGEFRNLGIEPATPVNDDVLAALLPIETERGMQYRFGLKNFYVITRYNRSTNYAMAVYEIAQGIKARVNGG
jgi:membrane-bound lytic murein transglycosylase B